MKVLLIRPPTFSYSMEFPQGPRFGLPLSLLYLAAVLEKNGISVRIYDAQIDFDIRNPAKNEQRQYHIGADWNRIAEKVVEFSPDIAGITNPFSDFAHLALKTAETIKQANHSIITVIGGPHASSSPETFFKDTEAVDYVIRGEGERSFCALIEALKNKTPVDSIPGVVFRKQGALFKNPELSFIENLDELPLPAYHLVDMERYFHFVSLGFPSRLTFTYPGSEREVSLITSRGCPFQCCFCGNHLHMGRRWRTHSAEYIIKHITFLIDHYAINHFHIEDDNLSLDLTRFDRILSAIISNRRDITWDTPNGIRADRLTEALVDKIRRSGCTYLIIGIESGNQRVLDTIVRKKISLAHIQETGRLCRMAHVNLHGFYIIGFPGETEKEIKDTFRFAEKMLVRYDVIPHLSLARPLPGTELFELCEKNSYFTEPVRPEIGSTLKAEVFPRVMIQTEAFTPALLEKWTKSFNVHVIIITIVKTMLFLLSHPGVWYTETRNILARPERLLASLKKVFFNRLLFKYCYDNPVIKRAMVNRIEQVKL